MGANYLWWNNGNILYVRFYVNFQIAHHFVDLSHTEDSKSTNLNVSNPLKITLTVQHNLQTLKQNTLGLAYNKTPAGANRTLLVYPTLLG